MTVRARRAQGRAVTVALSGGWRTETAVARLPRRSALDQVQLLLDELRVRYGELSIGVIRQQALEVLCLAEPQRPTPAMVARLVEARLTALL